MAYLMFKAIATRNMQAKTAIHISTVKGSMKLKRFAARFSLRMRIEKESV